MQVSAGDIIGFSGFSFTSGVINCFTYGVPRWNLSHVGIIAHYDCEPLLFESTTLCDLPCEIQKKCVRGVQAHVLEDRIKAYPGKIWRYPLLKPLRPLEDLRLSWFLTDNIGKDYDMIGAVRSGGLGFSWLESKLRPENLESIFCSELCAAAYKQLDLLETDNASSWNPNRLIRVLRKLGLIGTPERLK